MTVVRWLARGMREVPEADDWLSPAEVARLSTLRFAKRRSELRLARWTAKHLIARTLALGTDREALALIEIRPAPTGAPRAFHAGAPAALAVSMTDRADWAVCAAGPAGLALGCDLELVEPRTDAFVRDWFTARERDVVFGAEPGEARHVLANLIWSAKESALKVLQTGLRRDTRSVEVELGGSAGTAGWAGLRVRVQEGTVFPGWWRRYGDFLLTCVADAGHRPPECVEEPPSLATAVPSHTWFTEL